MSTGDRPLPNDPDVVYQYLTNDTAAVAANAGILFVLAARWALPLTGLQGLRGQRFGLLAVAALTVSVALSVVLAGVSWRWWRRSRRCWSCYWSV